MSGFTRLTVRGARRRVDVVVASDEPLGVALPPLLDMLRENEQTVTRPATLIGADGEQIDIARTPEQLALRDGALLRLVRLDAAPPPPVVIDVVDVAADARGSRRDRWDDRSRRIVVAWAVAIGSAGAGVMAPFGDSAAAAGGRGAAILALLAMTLLLGATRGRTWAVYPVAAATGVTLPFGAAMQQQAAVWGFGPGEGALLAAGAVLAAGAIIVLVGVGAALRRRGALAGGILALTLAVLLLGLLAAGVAAPAAAAVVGTVAAFATGPVPWIALMAAGLDALERRVAAGDRVTRPRAMETVDDAYEALTWSVAAVAAPIALSGVTLVIEGGAWNLLLALAFAVVAALRSRAFPLRAEVSLLWAAAAAIALTAVGTQLSGPLGWVGVASLVVAMVVMTVAASVRPAAPLRARLRGIGNALESIAVVALLPLLLGALGVYSELLGMFPV